MRRILTYSLLLLFALLLGACGSIAQPVWEASGTQAAAAEIANRQATEVALGLPTSAPATSTPTLTPTLTSTPTTPPTATFTATPDVPTETPTLAATATEASPAASGDAENGMVLFNAVQVMPDGQQWACSQCHSVTPDQLRLIGPGLWGIGERAATRVEGEDALAYITHSIVRPHDYLVVDENGNPYPPLMPNGYEEVLGEDGLADVIAYLLTLE
ncbi:MAG: c-type cytochrome [Chloroflexota bacterium]|nr:c-type cytochrome [Chloroflexota bacterium]